MIVMSDRSTKPNREYTLELAICCTLVLLSFWGIIWYATSGLLRGDIDGILLMSVCVLIGSLFSIQVFLIARSAGWLNFSHKIRTIISPEKLRQQREPI
jgi:hypothetical protein